MPTPLPAVLITPENFRLYGQVIAATPDHQGFDAAAAQLSLEEGIPHFYIMRLPRRGRKFGKITRHVKCTQCLGSLEGKEWLIAVAPPGATDQPDRDAIAAFRIPGNCFIKLERGTWHAGPYFDQEAIDFYNLELTDTNIVDHHTCDLKSTYGIEFEIVSDARSLVINQAQ
jgi:ureidoglycolate hydrolase